MIIIKFRADLYRTDVSLSLSAIYTQFHIILFNSKDNYLKFLFYRNKIY